jgi:hypothetical protein
MKVKLLFASPFIVGGIKQVSNYIESIDYIPGNVVRAAFARYILSRCVYFDPNDIVEVNNVPKKNWVYFKDKPECHECKLKSMCQKFGDIEFSFFYPEGAEIIPKTMMICKTDPQHGLIDQLIHKPECVKCRGGKGRVEAVSGYLKEGRRYSVVKNFVTKTAINNYTGTAKDGALYSLVAVSATERADDATHGMSKNVFAGEIEGVGTKDLSSIEELRIGKYISVGFGRCRISPQPEEKFHDYERLIKLLHNFNQLYKEHNKIHNNIDENLNYFAIKFVSDARLDFQIPDIDKYIKTKCYKNVWSKALGLSSDFIIERVYAESFNFRGYDTSKVGEDNRDKSIHVIEKGSVIVFKTQLAFEKVVNYFSTIKGLGHDIKDGFGHIDYHFGGV